MSYFFVYALAAGAGAVIGSLLVAKVTSWLESRREEQSSVELDAVLDDPNFNTPPLIINGYVVSYCPALFQFEIEHRTLGVMAYVNADAVPGMDMFATSATLREHTLALEFLLKALRSA